VRGFFGEGLSVVPMIGIVLVTHGRLAEEFLAATQHIVGPLQNIKTVCIGPEDDMEARQKEITAQVSAVDTGHGVVFVTDMFGGTPCNLALSHLQKGKVEVLAGANLPSLVKLVGLRDQLPVSEAVREAIEAGRKYMRAGSSDLPNAK
jgi:PTS system mannose-specific IIA component